MKFLFDLFPVILFFITYKLTSHNGRGACLIGQYSNTSLLQEPILLATSVAITATIVQVGWLLFRGRKVDAMLWVSLIIILIFGGATLYFRNAAFIQWKPSILYWTLASALLLASTFFNKNLIKELMGKEITLPERIWGNLNFTWAAFFIALGIANLVAANKLSCDNWVNFKVYGVIGLTFLFGIAQTLVISKHIVEKDGE
jgi:intracellular septation protein